MPRPSRRIQEAGAGRGSLRLRAKLHEPSACPDCRATYHKGRWTWRPAPADAPLHLCPACARIRDDYPDGYVLVSGAFARAHRSEIVNLARHVAEREKKEHPLKRLMGIAPEKAGFRIQVTERKLARSIGRALKHAYAGRLAQPRVDAENLLRVHWSRD
jgi:hypothetical protein